MADPFGAVVEYADAIVGRSIGEGWVNCVCGLRAGVGRAAAKEVAASLRSGARLIILEANIAVLLLLHTVRILFGDQACRALADCFEGRVVW